MSQPPFTAYGFKAFRTDANVLLDGDHFMTVNTLDGAKRLAAILNEAVALAEDGGAIGNEPRWSRTKIAFAVAKALGRQIDFQQAEAA